MLRTAARQFEMGHTVAVLGAQAHRAGLNQGIETFDLDVPDYHTLKGLAQLRAAKDVLWSKPAARVVGEAMKKFQPDVVHLHNYAHQLSSSILLEIRNGGIPCIYTAHDYKLICPAYVANVDNMDCFACSTKLSMKLLRERCHHDSAPWSTVVGLEAILVRSRKLVPDIVIGPSQFMTDAMKSSWLGELADVQLLRNPVEQSGHGWTGEGDFLLYVGRLSREKGVEELLIAAAAIGIPLKIAGEGPLREALEDLANSSSASVEFLGHIDQTSLGLLRKECRAQVVSSTWPENAPLSALEAAADGVPLIVTARGGLPEFVAMGARVAVVNDLGQEELARAVHSLPDTQNDLERFRDATSWESHLKALNQIYADSLGG